MELTEEEKRKQELEQNEEFMKYIKLYKIVKVPLANLKQKMKAEGKYKPIDLDVSDSLLLYHVYSYLWKTRTSQLQLCTIDQKP